MNLQFPDPLYDADRMSDFSINLVESRTWCRYCNTTANDCIKRTRTKQIADLKLRTKVQRIIQ